MITNTSYLDILPNQRIVISSTMTIGENRVSAALVTFEFLPTAKGTDLICTHQGAFFEGSGGPEMRQDGWRKQAAGETGHGTGALIGNMGKDPGYAESEDQH